MKYSLVVPYFKTPEITRLCLYSIFKFSRGEAEVIVVDNAPGSAESGMLREFKKIKILENSAAPLGSAGNFHALELGVARASWDLVGLLHSDTVFLREGWDLECFGRLERDKLAALGTFERESDPFGSFAKKTKDWLHHLRHDRYPGPEAAGKLMVHFLLTRRGSLQKTHGLFANRMQDAVPQFLAAGGRVEVLSRLEMSRILWHTSNITSLLTGQMDDSKAMARYRERRHRLLADEKIRAAFGPVLPRD